MACPIFQIEECSPTQLQERIQANAPCVIRGFFNPETVAFYLDHIEKAPQTHYNIGNVPAYYIEKRTMIPHPHVDALLADPLLLHSDVIRLWKHNAGNVTRWHYDGNGTDLLNISLQGAKDFYLAPPNSLPVYPLSNIALPIDFRETVRVEIKAGDLLLIPAYWFHKVVTTADQTLNINYVMYNKNNPQVATDRHQELFMLHKLAKTTMDREIVGIHQTSVSRAVWRGVRETLPILFLFLIFYVLLLRVSVQWALGFVTICIIASFVFFGFRGVDNLSSGMARLMGLYMFVYSILLLSLTFFFL